MAGQHLAVNRFLRWVRRGLLCGLLAAMSQGGQAEEPLELRIGIAREATLPLATVEHGVLRGLSVDLARLLTETLGLELALSLLPERELVDALKGGRIDLILTSMTSDELAALHLLASSPLLRTGQMAVIRQQEMGRFPRPIDVLLTNGRVGYERGSIAARVVHQRIPNAERVPFAEAHEAVAALESGSIDVLILDGLRAWNLIADPRQSNLIAILDPLTTEYLTWAVRDSEVHLLARIDAAIAGWRGATTLARLISRWVPLRIDARSSGDR